jgi:glucosamine-phosphate N-acetyltransferase
LRKQALLPHDGVEMIEIRDCINSDFDQVFGLLRQLWPDRALERAMIEESFLRGLGSDSHRYISAVVGDSVVGFCSIIVRSSIWAQGYLGYIDELVVDEVHRGKGIGGRLLQQAVELAKEAGCRKVELDSAFHREEAHKFYERQGFESRGFIFFMDV